MTLIERLLDYAADDDYTRKDGTIGTTNRAEAMREAAAILVQSQDWIERERAVGYRDGFEAAKAAQSQDALDARRLEWLADKCSVNFLWRRDDGSTGQVSGPTNLRKAIDAAISKPSGEAK